MQLIKYLICTVLVLGNQKIYSTSKIFSCVEHDVKNNTSVTTKKIKCLVEKDLIVVERISKHKRHLRNSLDALNFTYDRMLNVTSEIGDKHEYLGNVMNVFSLLRRVAKDWVLPLKMALQLPVTLNPAINVVQRFIQKSRQNGLLPLDQEIDMKSAYSGLSRIQNVYIISTDTLVNGKVEGAATHTSLTADDCFEFAKYYYYEELNYHRAVEWLDQTMMKLQKNNKGRTTEKAVLELYFLAKCFTGDFETSKLTYLELVSKYNKVAFTLRLLEDFEIMAKYGCKKAGKIAAGRNKIKSVKKKEEEVGIEDYRDVAFKDLKEEDPKLLEQCNHLHSVYSGTAKYLKCRYTHHPALGFFKIEEYHLNPPIILVHDFMSEPEITELIMRNKPLMRVSPVAQGAPHWGAAETYGGRVESVWVSDNGSPETARLTQRVELLTGWSNRAAEPFKLISYGVSGALQPHVDTTRKENNHPAYADYSTIMIHLNNVEKGGHTIFPALNVTVAPVKGSALLWFNRKPDGSSDELSLHASCPVLQSNKWTLNKWFHTKHQTVPQCTKKRNSSFKYFYLHE